MSKEKDAKIVLDRANACKEHHSGIEWNDVKKVVAAFEGFYREWNGPGPDITWRDREGVAILLLRDGRIASVWEAEDTSGHG